MEPQPFSDTGEERRGLADPVFKSPDSFKYTLNSACYGPFLFVVEPIIDLGLLSFGDSYFCHWASVLPSSQTAGDSDALEL